MVGGCRCDGHPSRRRRMYLLSPIIIFVRLRGCYAFHIRGGLNHRPVPTTLFNSKFPGIMEANVSSSPPSDGSFDSLTWIDEYDMNCNKRCQLAILPDDELPPDSVDDPPSMHNKRTLYYQQSLLSIEEAKSLRNAAEQSCEFIESNQLAGIIEDGVDVDESLASLLNPILASKIIPWARDVSSAPHLTVADALIRVYDPSQECLHLTEHYDESSFATVIIPLNDPNDYEGGLYVQSGASSNTRLHVPFTAAGDAVLHKYDVMHGVNVRGGKKRWSLVLWLGEDEESVKSKTVPWVIREAKSSVHAAFLFAYLSQNGLLGFNRDLETAKQYYGWASQRGHALSEYKLWLMENDTTYNKQFQNECTDFLADMNSYRTNHEAVAN